MRGEGRGVRGETQNDIVQRWFHTSAPVRGTVGVPGCEVAHREMGVSRRANRTCTPMYCRSHSKGNNSTTPDDISTRTSSAVTLHRATVQGAKGKEWGAGGGGAGGRMVVSVSGRRVQRGRPGGPKSAPGQEEEGEQGRAQHANLKEKPAHGVVVGDDVRHVPVGGAGAGCVKEYGGIRQC